jgi:hypothetical protein
MGAQGQSFKYPRAQASALRLIDKFGQPGAILRDVPGSGSEWDAQMSIAMRWCPSTNRGLTDLSVSRTTLDWGAPVSGDKRHTMYVWVDATRPEPTCISKCRQEREVQRIGFTSTQAFKSLVFNARRLTVCVGHHRLIRPSEGWTADRPSLFIGWDGRVVPCFLNL